MFLNILIIVATWMVFTQLVFVACKRAYKNVFESFVAFQAERQEISKKEVNILFGTLNLFTVGIFNLLLTYVFIAHRDMEHKEKQVNVKYFLKKYKE